LNFIVSRDFPEGLSVNSFDDNKDDKYF